LPKPCASGTRACSRACASKVEMCVSSCRIFYAIHGLDRDSGCKYSSNFQITRAVSLKICQARKEFG
jgi:hypothetical protein